MADKVKFALALVILAAGVAVFYILSEQAMVLRVLAVLAGLGCSLLVASKTAQGQNFGLFAADAWLEAKKVVWPSRKETTQTTAAVFGFVVIMALFLYFTDKTLEWALYDLVLGWKK